MALICFPCKCGRDLVAPSMAVGLRSRCPRCGDTVTVPPGPEQRPNPTDTSSWRMLIRRAKSQNSTGSQGV
jgi:hypothetical protein